NATSPLRFLGPARASLDSRMPSPGWTPLRASSLRTAARLLSSRHPEFPFQVLDEHAQRPVHRPLGRRVIGDVVDALRFDSQGDTHLLEVKGPSTRGRPRA